MSGGGSTLKLKIGIRCGNGDSRCKCGSVGNFTANKVDSSPVNGFTKYTHYCSGGTFTLNGELQDGSKIGIKVTRGFTGGKPIQNVKEVSVFYWEDAPSNPLLLGITTGGGSTSTYYAKDNDGSNWNFIFQSQSSKELEEKLDELVCLHHNAVTVNLSYKGLSGGQHNYCCTGNHVGGHNRVSVKEQIFSCAKNHTSTPITAHKHSINGPNLKLAGIKFYLNGDQGQRRRVTSRRLSLPIQGPVDVYAFYCKQNPSLIYVDAEKEPKATGWYRKTNSTNWTQTHFLRKMTPDKLTGPTDHGKYNDLVILLKRAGCNSYSTCPGDPQTPPVEKPPEGSHPEAQQPADPALGPGGGTAEKLGMGVVPAAVGIWSISGTLAGSAATFFGGWKLYNRYNGDPWVRHRDPIEFLKHVPY
ncbi:hypothetical protein BEWA_013820 [Theileria equi strain WA]|uniref:Uncharacterized protein n=1 Tax=Theileria equi strain WA TaxID=1537102 RepID=L1LCE6_THEEQ|nr:hypothetical protein BEWA_013820 [Theileria equi strain WA]EKX72823.1 hypothetical protein BEWA_013820 [Theileria equi strain WA]|eukprot:XP_004832275.1 hypothetical protein BEWA_013820 [Theileria equi strain WA]